MQITPILVVDRALRDAGIPITGVSIDVTEARETWRIFYLPAATPAQRTAGDALLATLDLQDPATVAAIKADLSTVRANDELIRAIAQGLYEAIPAPTMTLPQLKTRILIIYRGLL